MFRRAYSLLNTSNCEINRAFYMELNALVNVSNVNTFLRYLRRVERG